MCTRVLSGWPRLVRSIELAGQRHDSLGRRDQKSDVLLRHHADLLRHHAAPHCEDRTGCVYVYLCVHVCVCARALARVCAACVLRKIHCCSVHNLCSRMLTAQHLLGTTDHTRAHSTVEQRSALRMGSASVTHGQCLTRAPALSALAPLLGNPAKQPGPLGTRFGNWDIQQHRRDMHSSTVPPSTLSSKSAAVNTKLPDSAKTSKDLLMALFLNTGKSFSAQAPRTTRMPLSNGLTRRQTHSQATPATAPSAKSAPSSPSPTSAPQDHSSAKHVHFPGDVTGEGHRCTIPWEIARSSQHDPVAQTFIRTRSW